MVNCNYKIVFALTHIICIRVAAAAEEVVYEVVAEPQEPLEQAQQEERRETQAQGQAHPRAAAIRQAPVHVLLF